MTQQPLLRSLSLTCALLLGVPAMAATSTPDADSGAAAAAKPATKQAGHKSSKASPQHEQLRSEAQSLALAITTVEAISQTQLDIATRVLTGTADCEFNQQVTVTAVAGHPGFFSVGLKGQHYIMVPEETKTGAIRLLDQNAGMVWLQIPMKSMLMNSKLGQRVVDSCQQTEQRVAVRAAAEAGAALGEGIGIVPQTASATAAAGSSGVPAASR